MTAPLNKYQVLLAHHEHPDWVPTQIAKHLNCDPEYVRRHLRLAGKQAPRGKRTGRPRTNPKEQRA